MKYWLGVDGGGTKTEAVLCDENGHTVARALAGATNPNGQSQEAAKTSFQSVLREAVGGRKVVSAFAGIAGVSAPGMKERYEAWAREVLGADVQVRVDSDVACTMTAALDFDDGIAAIAGTGSSAFVRVNGRYTRVGGWGYFLEDAGSGFELGRQALIAWSRSEDGRDVPGVLDRLCREMAGSDLQQALTGLYAGGRTEIARFAPCVFEALEQGDMRAREIVENQIRMYTELLQTAERHLRRMQREAYGCVCSGPARVALGGSIWKQPAFRSGIQTRLGDGFALVTGEKAPVYGAVREAMRER